jgi:phosphoglycerol transferase MdoB-like AlkP superfamily enzyme
LFGFWFFLERIFRLADKVTVERDEGTGIRAGGWMLSLGLIFGGAVAGDWESLEGTVRDFIHYAWVAIVFLVAAVAIEWAFKRPRKKENSGRGASAAIAAAYVFAATVYVFSRGMP